MNIIEVLVPFFALIILFPILEKIYNMLASGRYIIEGLKTEDLKTEDLKTEDLKTETVVQASPDKSTIEDATTAKIISDNNKTKIKEIEKSFNKYAEKTEGRVTTIESTMANALEQSKGQEGLKDDVDILKTQVETNKIGLADMKQKFEGAPTVDFVNSKVGNVESEMEELQRKYKEMRKEYQSFKNA